MRQLVPFLLPSCLAPIFRVLAIDDEFVGGQEFLVLFVSSRVASMKLVASSLEPYKINILVLCTNRGSRQGSVKCLGKGEGKLKAECI